MTTTCLEIENYSLQKKVLRGQRLVMEYVKEQSSTLFYLISITIIPVQYFVSAFKMLIIFVVIPYRKVYKRTEIYYLLPQFNDISVNISPVKCVVMFFTILLHMRTNTLIQYQIINSYETNDAACLLTFSPKYMFDIIGKTIIIISIKRYKQLPIISVT